MSLCLVVGVGVGGEVGLDGLEEVGGLLFAFLDMLLLDLVPALRVVLAAALHNRPAIRRGHQFGLVTDLLDDVAQGITLDHGVAVSEVLSVDAVDLVLHVLVVAALAEGDLLDGPGPTISLQDLGALDGLGHDFRDEVVGVEDQGLEEPCRRDRRGGLGFVCENTHDLVVKLKEECLNV